MHLVILGHGVSARTLLYELSCLENHYFSEITVIGSEEFYPQTSLRSTRTVALRGIEPNTSELGDDLLQGFSFWHEHYAKKTFSAIQKMRLVHLFDQSESMHPRFQRLMSTAVPLYLNRIDYIAKEEWGYWVHDSDFLQELTTKAQNTLKINFIYSALDKVDCSHEKIELLLQNKVHLLADKVVVCAGAYFKVLASIYPDSSLFEKTKIVQGAFWKKQCDLGISETINLHHNSMQMVYSPQSSELLIGNYSQEASHFMPPELELKNIHQHFSTLTKFAIPSFSTGEIIVGLRHKARQRKLMIERSKFHPNLIYWGGQYKNGFILNFFGAKKVLELLHS